MIFVGREFDPETLLAFLGVHFPETQWFHLDLISGEKSAYDPSQDNMGFCLDVDVSDDYPININLLESDEAIIAVYQSKIAEALSKHFEIKTVIDFTHPDHPADPYYSLLYDKGECYLVSDSLWEETQEFQLIGPWPDPVLSRR